MSYTLPKILDERAFTVLGAGTLGRRIALMWLSKGGIVHLYDSNPDQTKAAKEYIDNALGQVISDVVHDGKAGSLRLFSDRDEALKTSWIVVEAIPEVKQLKIDLLGELDSILPLDVILATNSSSYTPSELNAKVKHKDRLISTHYYMPPSVLALEVMPSEDTHPDIAPLIMKEAANVGLKPYHVRKESVGLIANRIWAAIKRECLYVASQGIAEPAEIDALLKDALGFKVPPFQLMDSVGLDVVLDIEQHYQKTRPGQCPPEAAAFAESYVKQGKLGVKSGQGFYKHPKDVPHAGKDQLIYLDIVAAEVQCITTDGAEVKTLVSGLPHTMPDGVQFDSRPGKSHIYWTAMGKTGKDNDGTLWRANLDGTEVKKIVIEGQTHTPKQLTLDAEGEKLYWCDREGGRIQRANLDGSSIETLYDSAPGASRPLQDTTAWCVGITIDKNRGLVYWTQKGGSKGFVGRIFRANINLPQGSSPGNRNDIQMLFENLPEPIDLDIDADKQILYWTDRGDPPMGNSICSWGCSSPLEPKEAAKGPSADLVIADRFHETIGLTLDTMNNLAYVADLEGSIWVVDLQTKDKKAIVRDRGNYTGITLLKGK